MTRSDFSDPFWPSASPNAAFVARRAAVLARCAVPAALYAGLARPRNFLGNRHAFRAESHFLYLVGRSIEGALLLLDPARGATLYVEPTPPDEELWTGPIPTLEQLEAELGLPVRSMAELTPPEVLAHLPPQDGDSADDLALCIDRDVQPGAGDRVTGHDADLADALIATRLVHDEAAQAQLRQAALVTARAHRAGLAATRPGVREAFVRGAMEGVILSAGMTCSYHPIVTAHGEVLHSQRHDGLLQPGDLLLADVGAETPEGWAGDVTRTWPVSGRFSPTQRDAYEAVLDAQLAAIDAVRPGVRYLDVHRIAGRTLLARLIELGIFQGDLDGLYERGAAALFFPHGIGHLLGLDVHDLEDLGDRAGYAPGRARATNAGDRYLRLDRDLVAGMAVTIEPGFYQIDRLLRDPSETAHLGAALRRDVLARFADVRGIRIEDDVLVTATGAEVLTAGAPKTIDALEAALAERLHASDAS